MSLHNQYYTSDEENHCKSCVKFWQAVFKSACETRYTTCITLQCTVLKVMKGMKLSYYSIQVNLNHEMWYCYLLLTMYPAKPDNARPTLIPQSVQCFIMSFRLYRHLKVILTSHLEDLSRFTFWITSSRMYCAPCQNWILHYFWVHHWAQVLLLYSSHCYWDQWVWCLLLYKPLHHQLPLEGLQSLKWAATLPIWSASLCCLQI